PDAPAKGPRFRAGHHPQDLQGARGRGPREPPAGGEGRSRVRPRGEPAGEPYGAVRVEGDRCPAREGRDEGDAREEPEGPGPQGRGDDRPCGREGPGVPLPEAPRRGHDPRTRDAEHGGGDGDRHDPRAGVLQGDAGRGQPAPLGGRRVRDGPRGGQGGDRPHRPEPRGVRGPDLRDAGHRLVPQGARGGGHDRVPDQRAAVPGRPRADAAGRDPARDQHAHGLERGTEGRAPDAAPRRRHGQPLQHDDPGGPRRRAGDRGDPLRGALRETPPRVPPGERFTPRRGMSASMRGPRWLGLGLLLAGAGLLAASVATGQGQVFLLVVFPVFVGTGVLGFLGVAVLFLGFVVLLFGPLLESAPPGTGTAPPPSAEPEAPAGAPPTRPRYGGLVVVGPFPIAFGSDSEVAKWMLVVGLAIAIAFVAMTVLYVVNTVLYPSP